MLDTHEVGGSNSSRTTLKVIGPLEATASGALTVVISGEVCPCTAGQFAAFAMLVSILTGLVRRVREAANDAATDTNRSEHPNTRNKSMAVRKSRSKAKDARPITVAAYLASLTPEKRTVIEEARAFVHKHIPKGYAEFMNWGVINWGIPLEEFSNKIGRAHV